MVGCHHCRHTIVMVVSVGTARSGNGGVAIVVVML